MPILPWVVISPDGIHTVSAHKTHADAVNMAHHLATIRAKLSMNTGKYKVRKP